MALARNRTGPVQLLCVAGARPNFIKMAALLEEFRRRPGFQTRLVHTGQHYSAEMSDSFFSDLGIPAPDLNLGVHGGSPTAQVAEMMLRLEPVLEGERPDLVVVVGDVNSTVAAAMAASRLGIRTAHVEAGLRSFDRSMPEEVNRVVTDALADYLFVSEPSGCRNLRAEGVAEERIFFTGNVMIDTLLRFREKAAGSKILENLGLDAATYAVVTLHRPSNVDQMERLKPLLAMLSCLSQRLPVVFPMHPRTRARIEEAGLSLDGVRVIPPLGYLDFLHLMSSARMVLTDSGGIQEETTILNVPCLTLRENTERPVTIEQGTNRLAGVAPDGILRAAFAILHAPPSEPRTPELWDGRAASRIAGVLERVLAQ